MLQFLGLKSAVYNQERFQIKSGLWAGKSNLQNWLCFGKDWGSGSSNWHPLSRVPRMSDEDWVVGQFETENLFGVKFPDSTIYPLSQEDHVLLWPLQHPARLGHASVWSFANPSLFLWWWFTFPVLEGGGALCTEGCCCLVVHWCLFSFGAHMCKFLQLIVVVIPFFHFLPKWQPGNAKVHAKQHRACSSSSQGLYKDLDETVHIYHVLMGRTKNFLNLEKVPMYHNKLYIGSFPFNIMWIS